MLSYSEHTHIDTSKAAALAFGNHSSSRSAAQHNSSSTQQKSGRAQFPEHKNSSIAERPAQLGRETKDTQIVKKDETQIVSIETMEKNLKLIQIAFPQLPKKVQKFLLSVINFTGEINLPQLLEQNHPLGIILNLDSPIIVNVLIGLKFMPLNEQLNLPKNPIGMLHLFNELATSEYSSGPSLFLPEEVPDVKGVEINTNRGVEHIANSCYISSVLNLIAAVPEYSNLFISSVNPVHDKNALLLQQTVRPLLRILLSNGKIAAEKAMTLIHVLDHLGILTPLNGETVEAQQDLGEVFMKMLELVQPKQEQLRTSNPEGPEPQHQTVLYLSAFGQPTLEAALAKHFSDESKILSHPRVLTIGMQRSSKFDYIDMPKSFSIPAAINHSGEDGPRYKLQGFITRNTFSSYEGGHYIAVIGDEHGNWFEMNDMESPKVDEPGVWNPSAKKVDVSTHKIPEHTAPSYALSTIYSYVRVDEHAGNTDRDSFEGSSMLGEDEILVESVFGRYKTLTKKQVSEREKMVAEYLKQGGSVWQAYDLIDHWGHDEKVLKFYFDLFTKGLTRSKSLYETDENYDKVERKDIPNLLREYDQNEGMLEYWKSKNNEEEIKKREKIRSELSEQIRLQEGKEKVYELFFSRFSNTETSLEIYGTSKAGKSKKRRNWVSGVTNGLLNARFLRERVPPLKIRITLRGEKTSTFASTHGMHNWIDISMEDYQIDELSVGESLGLIAHEIGVHTLDNTTLTQEQIEKEERDKDSVVTGMHGGVEYTVGKNPLLEKQQDDHLTVGRGILGQESAIPRLEMYEMTVISLIEAADTDDRRFKIAAAYCSDIARILATNDNSGELSKNPFKSGFKILDAAVNEWKRIVDKYGEKYPFLRKIKITSVNLLPGFAKLFLLLSSIDSKESKKDSKK